MWVKFKTGFLEAVERFIPTKMTKTKYSLSWIDATIICLMIKINNINSQMRTECDLGVLFKFIDKDLFLTLYKSLIWSHLYYGNLIFYPTTKKYKQVLENAQRRATRLVPELRGLSYIERLVELNLSTLDYRRKRFDIIKVFKIIHKIDRIDMNVFFSFAENTQLRGHNIKR